MRNRKKVKLSVGPNPMDTADRPVTNPRATSIDRLLHRSLILVVVSIVVVASGLHEFDARHQAHQSQDAAVKLLAHTMASQWRTDDALSADDLRRACQKLTAQPAILAAAVFNPQGNRLAQSARHGDLLPLLCVDRESTPATGDPTTLSPPTCLASEFPWIQRIEVDLGPQFNQDRPVRLALLVGAVDPVGIGPARWGFNGVVLTTAVGGLFLASRVWRRRIVDPVSKLMASSATRRLDVEWEDSSDELDDLGVLVRSFNELKEEAFHWRGQAERVERRMALQITSQTRDISRNLRRFQREAWLDPLTRVKNRRLLDEQFPTIFVAHRDADLDLSVVMLDLDHFKRLNDERGHQAGDEILVFVGELLRQCLRSDDIAVRYGGDEFVLILPGVSAEDAAALTKRLTALFTQRVKVMFDGQTTPGMTAGIASLLNNRSQTPHGLLAAADQALYQAKKSGRGRVQICRSQERMTA